MVKRVTPQVASHILRAVPNNAFLFARTMGDYTGESADSIPSFLERVKSTPLECIVFHLYPRPPDFERWIKETLGDAYLANQISNIDRSITGEALRTTMHTIIEDRLKELKVIAMTRVKGIGRRYANTLIDAGINFVEDLAQYEAKNLAHKLGISENVATKWIHNANQTIHS